MFMVRWLLLEFHLSVVTSYFASFFVSLEGPGVLLPNSVAQ